MQNVTVRHAAVVILLGLGLAPPASADKVTDLSQALVSDPDFKVRLTAAVVLSKLRDRRAEPALITGLGDANETVRGMSAAALGNLGDPAAIGALERLEQDRSDFVRARAQEALAMLRPRDPAPMPVAALAAAVAAPRPRKGRTVMLALGAMHDKSRRGNPALVQRLRETLVKQISEAPTFTLGTPEESGYVVDSTIDEVSRRVNDRWVEINCEVTLIVNRRARGMAGKASGGATVQVPRANWRPSAEEALQLEAVENAVHSAHPNLVELINGLQQ